MYNETIFYLIYMSALVSIDHFGVIYMFIPANV